jgi:hypothetical protein
MNLSYRWIVRMAWALVLIFAFATTTASATGHLRLTADPDVDFEDDDLDTVGIDFDFDGDFLIVLRPEGEGALGDATVPGYNEDALPQNALENLDLDGCACFVDVVHKYPGGYTFRIDTMNRNEVRTKAMARLAEIGCDIEQVGANVFRFTRDGISYRAVFNATEGGTLVYVGI